MPALTMKETPRPATTPIEKQLEGQIRLRAYEKYEARSHENGHELDDWLEAEIEITGNATGAGAA